MIILTIAAAERVKKILNKAKKPVVFRISVKAAGCSGLKYVTEVLDQPKADDIHSEQHGVSIYIAKAAEVYLRDMQLDCKEKSLGAWQWEFNNPHAVASCGCGESFAVKERKA